MPPVLAANRPFTGAAAEVGSITAIQNMVMASWSEISSERTDPSITPEGAMEAPGVV